LSREQGIAQKEDGIRIGIIEAGHIGGTLARLFVNVGRGADRRDRLDAVDAGKLAEGGRKHQSGSPAYTEGLHTEELRIRLAA